MASDNSCYSADEKAPIWPATAATTTSSKVDRPNPDWSRYGLKRDQGEQQGLAGGLEGERQEEEDGEEATFKHHHNVAEQNEIYADDLVRHTHTCRYIV